MIGDTIVAVASPPGSAAVGVLRLSGPQALTAVQGLAGVPALPARRQAMDVTLQVLGQPVPCLLLSMVAPRSFTGEDVVEMHLPGSPLLLDLVQQQLLGGDGLGLRVALPGEFTRRAFQNGRLDLAEAEAVSQLIHADSEQDCARAAEVLRGGLADAVESLKRRVLDVLALLESGLDFTSDETGAVEAGEWLPSLRAARTGMASLQATLPQVAGGHGELFLLGEANAGKSSLANALAGRDQVMVTDVPGTTRDVLAIELAGDGRSVQLLDGPGDLPDASGADAAALELRDSLVRRAAGVVLVVDATGDVDVLTRLQTRVQAWSLDLVAVVGTKRDLLAASVPEPTPNAKAPWFLVSNKTGQGLASLRDHLLQQAASGPAPQGSRLHTALADAAASITRAIDHGEAGELEELVALDLQSALQSLDSIAGRSSPEQVLDRIFGAFCLGK